MTTLANASRALSESFEYLPRIIGEDPEASVGERIPSPLLTDSAQILLVTAGYDHTIRFWDVVQGSCLATLQHNESQVNALSISPDKKLLAVAGNPNVRIFDIEETLNLALASSTSPNIQDFSASTANLQAKNILQGHTGNVTSIGFQSACQWLYTASADGALMIWDVSGLKCQREFRNKSAINCAALHPNQAEFLIADEAGYIKVVDLIQNSFTIEMCPEDYTPIVCVAVSENGQFLAVVNEKGNLYVWQAKTAQSASHGFIPLASIKSAHSPYAIKCAFSPNSEVLVTTGADGLAKHWAVDVENKCLKLTSTLLGHSHWVWDAAFSADSSFLLTGSSDNTARLWDLDSGEVICIYSGHAKAIAAVAINDSPINK